MNRKQSGSLPQASIRELFHMEPHITPNQVNLELFAASSYIMNKGEIKTETVKKETKKTETVLGKRSVS